MSTQPICFLLGNRSVADPIKVLADSSIAGQLADITSGGDGSLLAHLDATTIVIMSVATRLPEAVLEFDIAQQSAWPAAQAMWQRSDTHRIVSCLPVKPGFGTARATGHNVLAVAAALARDPEVLGAGIGASGLFYAASDFVEKCTTTPLPADVLVRCVWGRGPAGEMVATTRGLSAFDLPEIRQRCPSGESPAALYNRLINLAAYLLANGPVIGDGHTLGSREDEIILVTAHPTPDGGQILELNEPGI